MTDKIHHPGSIDLSHEKPIISHKLYRQPTSICCLQTWLGTCIVGTGQVGALRVVPYAWKGAAVVCGLVEAIADTKGSEALRICAGIGLHPQPADITDHPSSLITHLVTVDTRGWRRSVSAFARAEGGGALTGCR